MMRKIAILAVTLAATPCWMPPASAQNQAGGLAGNRSMSNMQHSPGGIGQPEFGFGANDMTVTRPRTGATAGNLGPSGMGRLDVTNSTVATEGFVAANPPIKP